MLLLTSAVTGEPLTYRGQVIVHDGPLPEAVFLVPTSGWTHLPDACAEQVGSRLGIPAMLLRDHPAMASVVWPIEKRNFRG
jgi:hypothetical protein